jgi:hypothetical protein
VSSQAVALPARIQRAAGWIAAARDRLLAVRPLYVLSTFIAIQWSALAALALTVRHNGWVYYMGGDQLLHYSGAYLLAHGKLGPTYVGVGWSTLLAPISWIAGPDLVSALPFVVLLNALVLLPLATLCVYGIAERIGGRLFGYWAALLWIVLPYVGIRYALPGYHQKWTELTLPQALGLGAMSDFPSVVALLVGAYLCLRAIERGHWLWGAGAGFAVGYALAIKPSNTAFLVAPGLLFLVFRRRAAIPFVAGLVPPLFVLGYWKERGFGYLPAFGAPPPGRRIAAGIGDVFHPVTKYFRTNSWTQLYNNLLQLREHLWSDRVLEFLAIAGIVALLLRSRRGGVFVGAWFVSFLLLKGTYINSSVRDATFWRLLLPALPAFVLIVAAVPLLVPGVRLRPSPVRARLISRRSLFVGLGLAAVAFVLFPTALIAAAKPDRLPDLTAVQFSATEVPVSAGMNLTARPGSNGVLLRWKVDRPTAGNVFYHVFRAPTKGAANCTTGTSGYDRCVASSGDLACAGVASGVPDVCLLTGTSQGTTREGTWLDRPGPGRWTYRIGLSANWLNDPTLGDVYVFSRPVDLRLP